MSIPTSLPGQVGLAEHDPELFDIIEHEKFRQWSGLELIASENFTSRSVMECLGSVLTNKVNTYLYYKYFILIIFTIHSMLKDILQRDIMVVMSILIKLKIFVETAHYKLMVLIQKNGVLMYNLIVAALLTLLCTLLC
jgi:hypothetical protein